MTTETIAKEAKGVKKEAYEPGNLIDSWPPELIDEYLNMSERERQKNFASIRDVATWLGVSESTVRNWCEMGRVRYIRLGGRRQIDVRGFKHQSDLRLQTSDLRICTKNM
jgi:excisionase family DNA binding protein